MTADERWERLKEFIKDEIQLCDDLEKVKEQEGRRDDKLYWHASSFTAQLILGQMTRLEREGK